MSASRWLIVSVHDVAPPHWERVRSMLDALDSVGVSRRSLLVIPNFQGRWAIDRHPAFCTLVRRLQTQGDEIVLHGYEHVGVAAPDGRGRVPLSELPRGTGSHRTGISTGQMCES